MGKSLSWKQVAVLIIGIIFFVVVLGIFNKTAQEDHKPTAETNQNNKTNQTQYSDQTKSDITGEEVPTEEKEPQVDAITIFYQACVEKRYDDAYSMLTDETKQMYYPTVETFKTLYCENTFTDKSTFTPKLVSYKDGVSVYEIEVYDDVLSSGKASERRTQDYITLVQDSGKEYKINLKGYIGKEEINKSMKDEKERVTVGVQYVENFMEYQKIKFTVKNNTDEKIMIDSKIKAGAIYIEDDKGTAIAGNTDKNSLDELELEPQETQEMEVEFTTPYKTTIKKISFAQIGAILYL